MRGWFFRCARMALGAALGFAATAGIAAPAAVSDAAREIASLVRSHDDHGRWPFAVASSTRRVYRGDGSSPRRGAISPASEWPGATTRRPWPSIALARARRSAVAHGPGLAARRRPRASAGCVVVPVTFYEAVVQPLAGKPGRRRLRAARATPVAAVLTVLGRYQQPQPCSRPQRRARGRRATSGIGHCGAQRLRQGFRDAA